MEIEKHHEPLRGDSPKSWLILFPEDVENNPCRLFNPEEKDKLYRDRCHHGGYRQSVAATMIVVTVTGQVLKVEKIWRIHSSTWSFRVYKVYSSGSLEKIDSLGDEALLLDQGITVLANDTNGLLIRNSIYFSYTCAGKIFCVFNLVEQKMEQLHRFDSSSSSVDQFSRGRWFLPSFTQPSC